MIYFCSVYPWFSDTHFTGKGFFPCSLNATLFVCCMWKNSKHFSRSACSTIIMNNEKTVPTPNSTLHTLDLTVVITHWMMNKEEDFYVVHYSVSSPVDSNQRETSQRSSPSLKSLWFFIFVRSQNKHSCVISMINYCFLSPIFPLDELCH